MEIINVGNNQINYKVDNGAIWSPLALPGNKNRIHTLMIHYYCHTILINSEKAKLPPHINPVFFFFK